jgi:hypothetical protein
MDFDLTVSTARYRSVLPSERAPYITKQVNVRFEVFTAVTMKNAVF